jgi:hypothetical protein
MSAEMPGSKLFIEFQGHSRLSLGDFKALNLRRSAVATEGMLLTAQQLSSVMHSTNVDFWSRAL